MWKEAGKGCVASYSTNVGRGTKFDRYPEEEAGNNINISFI